MELKLKFPYLADENEREEGAKFFTNEFSENSNKTLIFHVGPFENASISEQIERYVNSKLQVQSMTTSEKGFFTKKKLMSFTLKPQFINQANMLTVSNAMYDLILALDVTVNVKCEA